MNYDNWLHEHVSQRMANGGNDFAKEIIKTNIIKVAEEATRAILEKEAGHADT